jgi:ABC-type molybdate transport system permease subunit
MELSKFRLILLKLEAFERKPSRRWWVVRPLEVATTLRASPLDTFFTVLLPLSLLGFISASILTFAHTVGEFGVVLMIGGNLPGVTRVASVQIYDHVEALEYAEAHRLAVIMLVFLVHRIAGHVCVALGYEESRLK